MHSIQTVTPHNFILHTEWTLGITLIKLQIKGPIDETNMVRHDHRQYRARSGFSCGFQGSCSTFVGAFNSRMHVMLWGTSSLTEITIRIHHRKQTQEYIYPPLNVVYLHRSDYGLFNLSQQQNLACESVPGGKAKYFNAIVTYIVRYKKNLLLKQKENKINFTRTPVALYFQFLYNNCENLFLAQIYLLYAPS